MVQDGIRPWTERACHIAQVVISGPAAWQVASLLQWKDVVRLTSASFTIVGNTRFYNESSHR